MSQINFEISATDDVLVEKIVERAHKHVYTEANGWDEETQDRTSTTMDVVACHLNGCPLDLQKLLDSDAFTFSHDIVGIRRHINRSNGQIENCFLPRCAAKE